MKRFVTKGEMSESIYQQLSSHKAHIFACTRKSQEECLERMLFSSNKLYEDKVLQVKTGDLLFLFNMDADILYGVFTAKSEGRKNIVPEAWNGKYPFQVEVEKIGDVKSIENAQKMFSKIGISWEKVLDQNKTRILLSNFGVNDSWGGLMPDNGVSRDSESLEEVQEKPQIFLTTLWDYPKRIVFDGINCSDPVTRSESIINTIAIVHTPVVSSLTFATSRVGLNLCYFAGRP